MTTARERRNHARSVRHRIEQQQSARVVETREAGVTTSDEFERDRQLARITLDVYGVMPISDVPHYLRHLGLNDVNRGPQRRSRDTMPPVIRLERRK